MAVYQICPRDNLDRKLQAQELARIMNERFVGLDVGLFPLCFFMYWQFINVTVFMPCSLNPMVFLGYVTSSPESRDYRVLTEKGRTKVRGTVVFWSCSIGIKCFWFVEFFHVLSGKTCFCLVRSINFFSWPQTTVETVKNEFRDYFLATVASVRTFPKSYCVSTEKAREMLYWKLFTTCMRRIKAETGFLVPDFDFVQSFSAENVARREIIQM